MTGTGGASGGALDVLCIGNAIVDVLAHASDADIGGLGLAKGTMTLIDAPTAERLYTAMGPAVEASGGSAGNTAAGLAALGARTAYIGKVRNDELGRIFTHDIRAIGCAFDSPPATSGAGTARCLIYVTPDAQRTMATYLGACAELGPDDVDAALVARAGITYLEGYLWDRDAAKAAFLKAAKAAHAAGRRVALSLSDPFCVDRHRDSFRELVAGHVDILFANESEILSLYQVESFDEALQRVRKDCQIAALTRSEKGSVAVSGDEVHVIDAERVGKVVDTTGAGDLFAAGFLYGLARGAGLATCGRLGSICAAEAISHMGPRPEADLKVLAKPALAAAGL
ncbi:MAG: adenosine kinase [Alphaproteobacteria bacterium]